jgi:hypothetical protein
MSANLHDLGDLVRVAAEFKDADTGTLINPDTVNVSIKTPAGHLTTYTYGTDAEVVRDSTGLYHLDVDADTSGTWYYRWFSTGSGQAAEEKRFDVRPANAID